MLGLKIGNYTITSTIGEGGMGAVYGMVHESLGRPAALKLLLPEISSSRDMVTRFFNEARAAASIRHPGIVDVYDFGFLPDGRAYIIMEYLDGESLGSRLRRVGRLPHAGALQIMRMVARALHAAHERGIVHRDLKPDNIFLVPEPELPTGERVKLLDFGIAKLGGDGTTPALTQTGAVMGTPMYMAPEQSRGAGAVDQRADLYALGCILYELLCGRPPFLADGAYDLIARHLYFQPESPRVHDPSISAPLEALVLSLLQKDPAHRPPTALALVDAIDRLGAAPASVAPMQAGGTSPLLVATPVTTLGSAAAAAEGTAAPRSGRRRKLLVAAVATLAVAGAAVAAVVASSGRGSTTTVAVAPSDAAVERPRADAAEVPDAPPAVVDAPPVQEPPADASVPPPPPENPKRKRTPPVDPRSSETGSARDPSRAASAAKLNEEGKELVIANRYAEASAKFRAAIARMPEPNYYFNLCVALFQEGKFGEALTACNAVASHNPSPEQRAKTDKLITRIRAEAAAQGIPLPPAR
jgi:serine/threonine-protein kinase